MKPCPLCQSDQTRLFFRKNYHDVLICSRCAFGFVDVLLATETLKNIYDASYFFGDSSKFGYQDYLSEKENRVHLFKTKAHYLIHQVPNAGRLLDVGCADGSFLELFPSPWVTEGVELSASMWEKISPAIRPRVFQGFFEDFQSNTPYDVITLWDVLDHVTDPKQSLKKVHALLKPGGRIGLVTGDLQSAFARLMGKYWYLYIPPVHLSYFSRKSIKRLLTETGFTDITIVYEGKRVSLPLVFYRVAHLIPWKAWQNFFQGIANIMPSGLNFGLNFFDVMTVWARKPGMS